MKSRILFLLTLMLTATSWLAAQEQFARNSKDKDDEPNWVWYTLLGNPTKYNRANDIAKTSDGSYLVQGITYSIGNFIWKLDAQGNVLFQKEYPFIEAFAGFALMENGYSVCGYWNEDNNWYIMLLDPQGDTVKTDQTYLNTSLNKMIPNKMGGVNIAVDYTINHNLIWSYLEQRDENLELEWRIQFKNIISILSTEEGLLIKGNRSDTRWFYLVSYSGEVLDSIGSPFPGYSINYSKLFNAHNGRVGAINNTPDQPGRLGFALLTAQGEVLMYQDSSIGSINGEGSAGVYGVQPSPDGGYFAPMTVDNNPMFPYQPAYLTVFKLTARGKYVDDTWWNLMWQDDYYLTGAAVSDSGRLVICTNIDFDLNGKTNIFVGELRFNPELPTSVVTIPGIKALHAYPNPAGERLAVELPPVPNGQLTVTSMGGNRVLTQEVAQPQTLNLNISDWGKGSYVITYRTNRGVFSTIVVKN